MVVLSFTVTDSKGRYVNGLKPSEFRILEDGILQKLTTFAEGSKPPVQVIEGGATRPLDTAEVDPTRGGISTDAFVGTNVFVLFDTSNYMYRGFVTPRMRSLILCADSNAPTLWLSIRFPGIWRGWPR